MLSFGVFYFYGVFEEAWTKRSEGILVRGANSCNLVIACNLPLHATY